MVNVAILGFGTVGSGVAEVIHKNGQHISEKVANQVNDSYLKANQQTDGVMSYNRMVDLMLAYEDKGDIQ